MVRHAKAGQSSNSHSNDEFAGQYLNVTVDKRESPKANARAKRAGPSKTNRAFHGTILDFTLTLSLATVADSKSSRACNLARIMSIIPSHLLKIFDEHLHRPNVATLRNFLAMLMSWWKFFFGLCDRPFASFQACLLTRQSSSYGIKLVLCLYPLQMFYCALLSLGLDVHLVWCLPQVTFERSIILLFYRESAFLLDPIQSKLFRCEELESIWPGSCYGVALKKGIAFC